METVRQLCFHTNQLTVDFFDDVPAGVELAGGFEVEGTEVLAAGTGGTVLVGYVGV